jgi:phosphatidylglycerophosphatase A
MKDDTMKDDTKKKYARHWALVTRHPFWWLIATWFGSGTARFASGTAGSLAALPFAYVIQITFGNFGLLIASLVMFAIGYWAAEQFLLHHPECGADPKQVVVDEVAGQWLLLCVLYPTWHSYLVGLVLFRLFDVVKPWPVCWADKNLKGALGVMFDDFLAAMYPIIVYLCLMLESQFSGAHQMLVPLVKFLGGSYVH